VAARTFLFNLRPPLLDSAGLEPALRQQLANGGRLEISSQPYQGTQVVLRLPE
jgi:signal transduction histidine kinase